MTWKRPACSSLVLWVFGSSDPARGRTISGQFMMLYSTNISSGRTNMSGMEIKIDIFYSFKKKKKKEKRKKLNFPFPIFLFYFIYLKEEISYIVSNSTLQQAETEWGNDMKDKKGGKRSNGSGLQPSKCPWGPKYIFLIL